MGPVGYLFFTKNAAKNFTRVSSTYNISLQQH
jgi:hypothetical protein